LFYIYYNPSHFVTRCLVTWDRHQSKNSNGNWISNLLGSLMTRNVTIDKTNLKIATNEIIIWSNLIACQLSFGVFDCCVPWDY